jgi:ATPase subunit of ABC transporter with duplicated ATPase domains
VALKNELAELTRQKQQMHLDLMKEQVRAKSSKARGQKNIQQKKWPTIVSSSKAGRATETSGHKKSAIHLKKQALTKRLSTLQPGEIIKPHFVLNARDSNQTLVTIRDGRVGYAPNNPVLRDLSLSINARDRIVIQGNNGSGKSTLIKAIMGHAKLVKEGDWAIPNQQDIGYLDQHYGTLALDKTVLETITCLLKNRPYSEIRKHLKDFLFRKNEEVDTLVSTLSGGEKARLSLAQIAALTPR